MYKKANYRKTSLEKYEVTEAETIEQKVIRFKSNKDGELTDAATPMIYTEKADGVVAGYDIRTDKWEIAIEGVEGIQTRLAAGKAAEAAAEQAAKEAAKEDAKGESTQGTTSAD